jgi:hypothetical protein
MFVEKSFLRANRTREIPPAYEVPAGPSLWAWKSIMSSSFMFTCTLAFLVCNSSPSFLYATNSMRQVFTCRIEFVAAVFLNEMQVNSRYGRLFRTVLYKTINKFLRHNITFASVGPVRTRTLDHPVLRLLLMVKEKLSRYRPLGFQKVEAPRISRQSAHEGGKVVSPTHRPCLLPGRIPGTYFC